MEKNLKAYLEKEVQGLLAENAARLDQARGLRKEIEDLLQQVSEKRVLLEELTDYMMKRDELAKILLKALEEKEEEERKEAFFSSLPDIREMGEWTIEEEIVATVESSPVCPDGLCLVVRRPSSTRRLRNSRRNTRMKKTNR